MKKINKDEDRPMTAGDIIARRKSRGIWPTGMDAALVGKLPEEMNLYEPYGYRDDGSNVWYPCWSIQYCPSDIASHVKDIVIGAFSGVTDLRALTIEISKKYPKAVVSLQMEARTRMSFLNGEVFSAAVYDDYYLLDDEVETQQTAEIFNKLIPAEYCDVSGFTVHTDFTLVSKE